MTTTLDELRARVEVLEDLEAIRRLKARYAQLCDAKYHRGELCAPAELDRVAREIAALFTADAVWDGGERFGKTVGTEAIYERFRQATFNFAIHYFIMPDIAVRGDTATGRWYLLQPATLRDRTGAWIAGIEEDEYRRVDGRWLMSYLKVDLAFLAPYEDGWARRNLLA